ncbi:MAG: hypothetical protein CMJ84_18610 [Planctomycetes bacterium]|nr:hypothetical protein [Planctomycetota bacterium]MDP6409724.1 hypothetical protein [Planctomycetota bacterium]
MNLEAFKASLAAGGELPSVSGPLEALALDARGDWDAAHRTVQVIEGPEAAWVHAYLHRKEGDQSNARYWYDRCARTSCTTPLAEEWNAISAALLGR